MPLPSPLGPTTLAAYSVLLAVGGVIGFAKAGSRPSLIAGLASAALAAAALALVLAGRSSIGYGLGAGLALLLIAFFSRRFTTTRKFMPSGLMALVSLVALIVCAAFLMQGGGPGA